MSDALEQCPTCCSPVTQDVHGEIEYIRVDKRQSEIDELKNQLDSARHSITVLERRLGG